MLIQHGLDHFHGLDLELEMLDHSLFHHDLCINHAFHQCFLLVIGQVFPHLHHDRVLLLHHPGWHPMFMHCFFISSLVSEADGIVLEGRDNRTILQFQTLFHTLKIKPSPCLHEHSSRDNPYILSLHRNRTSSYPHHSGMHVS